MLRCVYIDEVHGVGFFDRLLVGSTSLYVLRHGNRATLIVPPAG